MRLLPRLGTSRIIEPLPLLTSLGRTTTKSAENSTSPSFRLIALLKIDDGRVVRIRNREREVDAADDALIGSRVAKGFALEHIRTRGNLDTDHARVSGRMLKRKIRKKELARRSERIAPKDSMAARTGGRPPEGAPSR